MEKELKDEHVELSDMENKRSDGGRRHDNHRPSSKEICASTNSH